MNKRLRKKMGLPWKQKHNVMLTTVRLSRKKHHNTTWYALRYSLLPMGERDYKLLNNEYWDEGMQVSEYSYATHWFIALYCINKNRFRILSFPCASDGSSPTISPVRIFDYDRPGCKVTVFKDFEKEKQQILNDNYWD